MRPSWDDYFLSLVDQVATRATCDRGKSGCVVVRDKRIICTGYVGSPSGMPHCDEVGHDLKQVIDDDGTVRQHCVRTVHAEQNAIVQAARYGLRLEGTTVYCSMEPCRVCAMLIASTGIDRVVARRQVSPSTSSKTWWRPTRGSDLLPSRSGPRSQHVFHGRNIEFGIELVAETHGGPVRLTRSGHHLEMGPSCDEDRPQPQDQEGDG